MTQQGQRTATQIVCVDRGREVKHVAYPKSLIGPGTKLTLIEERDYQPIYFTANFQASDPIDFSAVDCKTFQIDKQDYPDVVQANGAFLYCSQGSRSSPSAFVLVDPVTKKPETLIDIFHGHEFSSVNEVRYSPRNRRYMLHGPHIWLRAGFSAVPELLPQVYGFSPEASERWAGADRFNCAMLICITDTAAIRTHAGPGDGRQFSFNPRNPSTCDLYSGCGDGIHVWDKNGTLIGMIIVAGVAANFCFAKGGIRISAEKHLYFAQLKIKGRTPDVRYGR
ncbi:uncharacterized protein V1513DRAFT_456511 [Lipomyces chichibuensis]|uniref:uncharacterized protein n=1 Tax=Lipomyces chichibuensis TaxID=1546026 RepID=UPI003343AE58